MERLAAQRRLRLKKRYIRDRVFRRLCLGSVSLVVVFLVVLFSGLIQEARLALWKYEIAIDGASGDTLTSIAQDPLWDSGLLSPGGGRVVAQKIQDRHQPWPARIWIPAADDVNHFYHHGDQRHHIESARRLNDRQISQLDQLSRKGRVREVYNRRFWTDGNARDPEFAGIHGAIWGSFYLVLITLLVAVPVGVGSAIYLEECAPKSRWSRLLEVTITNLAAVPSIVFGLLGLVILLGICNLPRGSSLVGGLTLGMMTLPTVIIAARSALKTVPVTLRMAALALGASPLQTIFHHILPLALPGITTGVLISLARAIGETAPLLMIGMMAYVPGAPQGITDPASPLPVQIFTWARSPEPGFIAHSAAAILVLLLFLLILNILALWVRRTFEHRW